MNILLLDDEVGVLNALARLLRRCPVATADGPVYAKVDSFMSPRLALANALQATYDLVISDYRMPEMDGVAFLKQFRLLQPDCARIVLSGYADRGAIIEAINEARIDQFIAKPWDDDALVAAISEVLRLRALRLETEALADLVRLEQGRISPQELERRRLERLEPGITQVAWDTDGAVLIDLGLAGPPDGTAG